MLVRSFPELTDLIRLPWSYLSAFKSQFCAMLLSICNRKKVLTQQGEGHRTFFPTYETLIQLTLVNIGYFKIFCILTWRDTFCELISSQMQRKSLNVVPCTERLFRILLQNCGEVRIILWYKNWVSEIIAVVLFVLLASPLSRCVCNWSASMFAVLL